MNAAVEALQKLRDARSNGALEQFCDLHGIALLVAFGSAIAPKTGQPPEDLDLAVLVEDKADMPMLANAFIELLDFQHVDVLDLNRATPLAKAEALGFGELLHEAHPQMFARRQMAALTERMETRHLRSLDLDLLAT